MAAAGGGNIKVVVRVRPFNSRGKSIFDMTAMHPADLNKKSIATQNALCR